MVSRVSDRGSTRATAMLFRKLNPTSVVRCLSTSSSQLQDDFNRAVDLLKHGKPVAGVNNDSKLKVYALFKQATEGSCTAERPSIFYPIDRAKYDAWKLLDGMKQDDAKVAYVQLVLSMVSPADSVSSNASNSSSPLPAASQDDANTRLLRDILFPRRVNKNGLQTLKLDTVLTSCDEFGVGNICLNRPNRSVRLT
jgi:acyl-CoA-binding protein